MWYEWYDEYLDGNNTNRNAKNIGLELNQQIILRHAAIDTQGGKMSAGVSGNYFHDIFSLIAHGL